MSGAAGSSPAGSAAGGGGSALGGGGGAESPAPRASLAVGGDAGAPAPRTALASLLARDAKLSLCGNKISPAGCTGRHVCALGDKYGASACTSKMTIIPSGRIR